HSFLSSTSLGASRVIQKYGSYQAVAQSQKALLEIVGLLYNLSPRDNPATPRRLPLRGKDLFLPLAGFSWKDLDILRSQIPEQDKVAEILIEKLQQGHPLFSKGSIDKPMVMAALLE